METVALIIIPILAMIYGYIAGLLNLISKIGIFVIGILLTATYSDPVSDYLVKEFNITPIVSIVIAIILAFVVSTITLKIVFSLLNKLIEFVHLGKVNKILGAIFAGAVTYVIMKGLLPYLAHFIG